MNKGIHTLFSSFLLPLSISSSLCAAEIQGIGHLAGPFPYSDAFAISGNGGVVVGSSISDQGFEAFRWTRDGGMVGLGDLSGGVVNSYALDLNVDGTVVVGVGQRAQEREAFRWTRGSGMVGLGFLTEGGSSTAQGTNSDGLIVVGYADSTRGPSEAFRWTSSGGMVGLGDLDGGGFSSSAMATNYDGRVVVGYGTSTSGMEAFRWTSSAGMTGLGDLAGGGFTSMATDVSRDGSVIVGMGTSANGAEAIRWTAASGMVGLGDLAGGAFNSYAIGVNADGSVVVGTGTNAAGSAGFRWTEANGMQSLSEWLADNGHTLSGWSDMRVSDVSDNGKYIVGGGASGGSYEAFIASESGLVGVDSFTSSLSSVGTISNQGLSSAQIIMHGAHGHPGANRALKDKRSFWLAGDLAQDDRHDSDDDFGLAEAGLSYRLSEKLTLSAALGKFWSDSDLLFSGNSDSDGYYLAIDADIRLPVKLPFYATLSYLHGRNDLEIRRGYLNAGTLDSSSGDTQQTVQALRARLQWQSAAEFSNTSLHPYVEYNYTWVNADGYTESGGGFPVAYNDSEETVQDWRLGMDLNYDFTSHTRFIGTLEVDHRVDKQGNGISGQLIGLSNFDISGRDYDQDWLRATVGVEQQVGNGRLSVTLNASTEGEDPAYWMGANYLIAF